MLISRRNVVNVLPIATLLLAAVGIGLPIHASANAVLTIQAENASQSTGSGWSTERSLSGYTGSGYIVWRGQDDFRTSNAEPPAGIKAYDFNVTQPGTYQFAARVQARVGNGSAAFDKDNDAWVKFTSGSATPGIPGDASKWTKFFVGGSDESWKNYSNGEQYNPTFFTAIQRNLPAGKHRVLIGGRSARFAIDRVGLTLIRATGNSVPVVATPTVPSTPTQPVPTPVTGDCTAQGATIEQARQNYASSCPTRPRKDCDPISGGRWLCSSGNISNTSVPVVSAPTPEPAPAPVQPSTPAQPAAPGVTGDCTAQGATIEQAKQNYASSCPTRPRKDCDPISGGRWLCSSGNISNTSVPVVSAPAPVQPSQPSQPSAPAQPSTPAQPASPTLTGDCTAQGATIEQARQNYASSCPTRPRKDCDPISGGRWLCSSGNISNTSVPVVSAPAPVQPSQPSTPAQPASPTLTGDCTAQGATIEQAKQNYASSCPTRPRKDCDPISGGRWLCSSGNIGNNATPVVSAPSTPSTPVPAPAQPATPPVSGTCTAEGATIEQAKQNFANNCPTLARRDCDPISGGRWLCSTDEITNTTVPVTTPAPPPGPGATGRISDNDLLVLHYDNCPDRDDGHAAVSGKAVIDAVGLQNILVVNGTCGASIRDRYQPSSVNVMRAVWGSNWLDGFNQESAAVEESANRWAATLANGDDVWVAEGGPSDFTAKVLRRIGDIYPSVNRKRVRVVQHSAGLGFNERLTSDAAIALVKQVADYRAIPDGNTANNGSADFNQRSTTFVGIANQSRYASEWAAAFSYLSPDVKLDFSDTVEILYIIDDTQTLTVNGFANRYLR